MSSVVSHQDRRTEILQAAYQVFAAKGYHGTNIADIAQNLGMGHGTFYSYFKNKLDIFSHVITQMVFARVAIVLSHEDPTASNNLEEYRNQILRICTILMDLFIEDPNLARLFFYEAVGIDPEINRMVDQCMDLFAGVTEQYLVNGVKKEFLRSNLNTKISARCIVAIILEGARALLRASDTAQLKKEWTLGATELLIGGMER